MASRYSVQKGALKIDSVGKPPFIKSRGSHPQSSLRRSSSTSHSTENGGAVPGRVRVAVRLRPQNDEELMTDADFADFVELQSELKRLTLRKNNWSSDTYEFDEVFTEFASQKRVYEVVAKPVVESVLDGYNGTVMAYGQTGTGKTFTLGQLGDEDPSARGIMVRSMEDILADISPESDCVSISYFQLYMETVQDLLDPSNDNISIVEDPKTGDVSLPGATLVEIRDQRSFVELLRIGDSHRFAANTKLNTESSRSHAILMVNVKRSVISKKDDVTIEKNSCMNSVKALMPPVVHRGKLVVVDLAGSERIHKSGSEGHALEEAKFINLSLSSLGKCINALAENNAHVPIRDSKLTRLLRDSFGGTARTSLIVTIGPSPRHRGETTSTVLFGQRAMKVENMLKIKEESDYKSLARKLEIQVDKLIVENERRQKVFEDEKERLNLESENQISDVERNFASELEKERLKCQMDYMESVKKLDEKWMIDKKVHETTCPVGDKCSEQDEVSKLKELLETEIQLRKAAEQNVNTLKSQLLEYTDPKAGGTTEVIRLRNMVEDEACQKRKLEEELLMLQSQLLELNLEVDEMRKHRGRSGSGDIVTEFDSFTSQARHSRLDDTLNGHGSVAKIFEEVGLKKILSLLVSEDACVRLHAVKVVANLAAEEANQHMIVGSGGLNSLLKLLSRNEDESVRRVAAGAIANLAMNEANQELIMSQGGISLLSITAADAEDPRTMRMVAGAIANLCGNEKLQTKLSSEGGIRALIGMVRCRHADVISQVARGIANFAKCESRSFASQGWKAGKSLLIENGALAWMVQNANNEASSSIRRHIELALCHMGQHEANTRDMISGGALWELVRICRECSRDDIKNLASKTLYSSPSFQAEMRRLQIQC